MVGNGGRVRRGNRSYLYRGNGLYVSAGRSGMACKQTAFRYLILSVRPQRGVTPFGASIPRVPFPAGCISHDQHAISATAKYSIELELSYGIKSVTNLIIFDIADECSDILRLQIYALGLLGNVRKARENRELNRDKTAHEI